METIKLKLFGMKGKYIRLKPDDVIQEGDIQCLMDTNPDNMTKEDFERKGWHEVMTTSVGDTVSEFREWRVFLRKV